MILVILVILLLLPLLLPVIADGYRERERSLLTIK